MYDNVGRSCPDTAFLSLDHKPLPAACNRILSAVVSDSATNVGIGVPERKKTVYGT